MSAYLTGVEVADMVGVTRQAVYNATRRGFLRPDAYAGMTPLYRPTTVVAWRRNTRQRAEIRKAL